MLWYLTALVLVTVLYFVSRSRGNWPDGPRGIPFIGVLPQKKTKLHQQLTNLVAQYGDFFSFNLGRRRIIVLSSPTTVEELVVKRGSKYSSRPPSSAQASIIGQGRMVLTEYGDEFRKHRKLMHSLLGLQNAKIFLPYQEYESRQTLRNILERPDAFLAEVARYSASVTFSLLIGSRFASSDAKIPEAMGIVFEDMFKKLKPGHYLVDWVPALNYLPDSLAPWRADAKQTFANMMEFWGVFYDAMMTRMQKGNAPDCFLRDFLQSPEGESFTDTERRVILSELLTAGSETTATALHWFFKAVVLYPDFIKSAQEELDRVVGRDRLPNWEDRPNLPYIKAVVEENHRWGPVAPIGVMHATSETDTYRGATIPSGTSVLYNSFAIHHNNEYYRDPERFMPERFLSEKDPRQFPGAANPGTHYGFGVGRRECPGKHVADASLYIVISRLLWAFDIELGDNPLPSDDTLGGFPIMRPVPFKCQITPRSEKVKQMIFAEATSQGDAVRMEDAAQYEDEIMMVMRRQGRVHELKV